MKVYNTIESRLTDGNAPREQLTDLAELRLLGSLCDRRTMARTAHDAPMKRSARCSTSTGLPSRSSSRDCAAKRYCRKLRKQGWIRHAWSGYDAVPAAQMRMSHARDVSLHVSHVASACSYIAPQVAAGWPT
jgi:hypothetical protein